MLKRAAAGFLGALSAANGALMLVAGRRWYEATPSVADTGPFNPHFVADVRRLGKPHIKVQISTGIPEFV